MRIGMAIIHEIGHVAERSNSMMIMERETRIDVENPTKRVNGSDIIPEGGSTYGT